MMIDADLQLSDEQAITASAVSTDIYDTHGGNSGALGSGLAGKSNLYAYVTVGAADFATLTSLQVVLQTDNDVAFGSPTVLSEGAVVAVAALLSGAVLFRLELGAQPLERYVRFSYVVAGDDATAGTVNAQFVESVPYNNK